MLLEQPLKRFSEKRRISEKEGEAYDCKFALRKTTPISRSGI